MKVKERKGWTKLNNDFNKWYNANWGQDWIIQKRWLSKELIARKYIKEEQISEMWSIFEILTDGCSDWKVQNKILSLITLSLDKEIGEDLADYIK